MKKFLILVLVFCIFCLSACSLFGGKPLGKDAALEIALKDAGVERSKAIDVDVELDSDRYNKWYDVEFDAGNVEYEYKIQAETGEILAYKSK